MPAALKLISRFLPKRSPAPISFLPESNVETVTPGTGEGLQEVFQQPAQIIPFPVEPIRKTEAQEPGTDSGLHDYVKNTDYWFNVELGQLERYAREEAISHARANLPRQDAPDSEELPVESILRRRATETILTWASRVHRKVQDGIQTACVVVGEQLVQMRQVSGQLQDSVRGAKKANIELENREQALMGQETSFEYKSMWPLWLYLPGMAILTVIEWIANVPVFSELWPQEAGLEARWQTIVDASEKYQSWSGLHTLGARIMFNPETSLLTLGLIIFLMFLTHVLGSNGRALLALRAANEPAGLNLASRRRQAWPLVGASVFGIVLVMSFLFAARGLIEIQSENRLTAASAQVATLTSRLAEASSKPDADTGQTQELTISLEQAKQDQDARQKRLDYAKTVNVMNWPILMLNLVLVVAATIGGYLHAHDKVTDSAYIDPSVAILKARIKTLEEEATSLRQKLRAFAGVVQASIAKAKFLASSSPLVDWRAKAIRLESVVSLFRAENARERGMDVNNILCFQTQRPLDLPNVAEIEEKFRVPDELKVWEAEFLSMRRQIGLKPEEGVS